MAEGMIDFAQSYFSFVIAQRALTPPSPSHLRPPRADYGGQAGRGRNPETLLTCLAVPLLPRRRG